MRTTFESSTIRQDFIFQLQLAARLRRFDPYRSQPCYRASSIPRPPQAAWTRPSAASGGLDTAVVQQPVDVQHDQQLVVEPVDATRVLADLRLQRRRKIGRAACRAGGCNYV